MVAYTLVFIFFLVIYIIILNRFHPKEARQQRRTTKKAAADPSSSSSSCPSSCSRAPSSASPSSSSTSGTKNASRRCFSCSKELKRGERCWALVPCKHTFHKSCAESPLILSQKCPACSLKINNPRPWIDLAQP